MGNRAQRHARKGFIERNVTSLAETLDHARMAEDLARSGGWLQTLNPQTKILGFGAIILAVVSVRHLVIVCLLFLLAVGLARSSRIALRVLATSVWSGVLIFTGLIALPAIFLTPGKPIYTLPALHWPITMQGLQTAGLLLTRAETTATLALTLVLSTRWTHVLKALRVLRVPTVLVVILGMTHRYIFLLLQLAGDFFVARRSRLVGALDVAQRRQIAAGAAGVLLGKSLHLSDEVYLAMQSRGFRGETYTLDDFRWRIRDSFALSTSLAVAAVAFWFDRR